MRECARGSWEILNHLIQFLKGHKREKALEQFKMLKDIEVGATGDYQRAQCNKTYYTTSRSLNAIYERIRLFRAHQT
jgi:hypothetical protein